MIQERVVESAIRQLCTSAALASVCSRRLASAREDVDRFEEQLAAYTDNVQQFEAFLHENVPGWEDLLSSDQKELLWPDKYKKRKPEEWAALQGIVIRDPDGWRGKDDPPFDAPITLEDFERRAASSTISFVPEGTADEEDPSPGTV